MPPSAERPSVLVVDDEEEIRSLIVRTLSRERIPAGEAANGAEALRAVRTLRPSVLVLDNVLPDTTGFALLDTLRVDGLLSDLLVIMITAYGTIEAGLEAIRRGCHDYAAKPFNVEDLVFRIRRALEHAQARHRTETTDRFHDLVGASEPMRRVFDIIRLVGPNDVVVLVEGPTGSGKELVARAIHRESRRRLNPFIPVNCGAIPESLIESELFGYERGAFTGASASKQGLFESADRGTLFLDEINSLPPAVQVKFLRFLETGEYIKVGGTEVRRADVRVVAATNTDLEAMVRQGSFREDLWFRLNVVRITLPSLSERPDDIPLLVDHFLGLFNRHFGRRVLLDPEVYEAFRRHPWKGNVRELKNVVQRLVLMNRSDRVRAEDLPAELLRPDSSAPLPTTVRPFREAKAEAVRRFETAYFRDLLRRFGGNILRAAEAAEMDRKHLTLKLKELGIDADEFRRRRDPSRTD